MTPALFSLLCERHRQERAHREMVAGITTAAVINTSVQLDKPVTWTDFAPSHRWFQAEPTSALTDAQRRIIHEHNVRALEMEIQLRAEHGTQ